LRLVAPVGEGAHRVDPGQAAAPLLSADQAAHVAPGQPAGARLGPGEQSVLPRGHAQGQGEGSVGTVESGGNHAPTLATALGLRPPRCAPCGQPRPRCYVIMSPVPSQTPTMAPEPWSSEPL